MNPSTLHMITNFGRGNDECIITITFNLDISPF